MVWAILPFSYLLEWRNYHDPAGKATWLDKAEPLGYCRRVSGTGFIILIPHNF
jgi:hypothetical protein